MQKRFHRKLLWLCVAEGKPLGKNAFFGREMSTRKTDGRTFFISSGVDGMLRSWIHQRLAATIEKSLTGVRYFLYPAAGVARIKIFARPEDYSPVSVLPCNSHSSIENVTLPAEISNPPIFSLRISSNSNWVSDYNIFGHSAYSYSDVS